MKTYITLADVASAARVSVTTVSLSLREHPRIPEATRQRIREIAGAMGYTPNALLSSLAAYRQSIRGSSYHANIGVLCSGTGEISWRKHYPFQERFLEGAAQRGRELGFNLEEFWLKEPGMSPSRLCRILSARSIGGLLLLPQPRSRSHLNLPWDNFSLVTMGYSLTRPQLNAVATNHFQSAMTSMRRLRALGYRRIGLLAVHESVERVNRTILGGYLVERDRYTKSQSVPSLVLRQSQFTLSTFSPWFMKYRPEAIFAHGFWAQILLDWLDKMKVSVPGDVGLAFSSIHDSEELSGIDENFRILGATAVDLMKGMMDRGKQGVPEVPMRVIVEGTWKEGKTLRRVVG